MSKNPEMTANTQSKYIEDESSLQVANMGRTAHSNFFHTRKRACIGYYESATLARESVLSVEHHIKI
ncbi:hypothetical protein N7494_001035 [Penicillium frequentans]|uniref:Uncharacterized protein n=1 Tax=Penicillium frequentans TaxID=3151616 RepID=A0AAD6GLJ2_9EURO|nr:hypothetical protein N7494_001035 [Penicillium glabrum]